MWCAALTARDGRPPREDTVERARATLSVKRLSLVIAEEGVSCVGFALLLPAGSGFEADPPEAAHLALLAVDPRAQGAGVGRRLLAAVEERAARVAPTVVLHVLTENASALALYTSVGWRPLGTPVPHPLSGASMLTLVRNLPAARRSRTGPRDTLSR
ncbi:GNAT family N-acetyltransferase [Rathayibacter rathayi]|uniref:GNAT family N-acetyltransferase n=1 Tax=Rathayibacter rathayi TaxID=33887 RepID=UPI002158355E|nr:GNAT family N-acetyltransferase [Rathayibacter rathayi]